MGDRLAQDQYGDPDPDEKKTVPITTQLDEFKTSIEMQDRRNRERLDHQTSEAKTRFDEMVLEARVSLGLVVAEPATAAVDDASHEHEWTRCPNCSVGDDEPCACAGVPCCDEEIAERGRLDLESRWCAAGQDHALHVWSDEGEDRVCPGVLDEELVEIEDFYEADITMPISATRADLDKIPEHMRNRIYVVDEDQILRYVDGEWKEVEE